ncbi:MAG: PA2169 family four-helix-bundle protein [Ferruginibacter sp.]
MELNEKLISVLNDLVQINHDRTTGYEKAADETNNLEPGLRAFFLKKADDSRSYAAKLTGHIADLGGESSEDTTTLGKIYRMWMDLKATFTGHDSHAILASCEFGEDAAQKAYKDALASDAEMSATTRQLITSQQQELKSSHDAVKKYRDLGKTVYS